MALPEAIAAYEDLSQEDRAQFKASAGLLPTPQGSALSWIWLFVIGILGAVVIGGGVLVYSLIRDDKATEVLVGFVSAALGALIGLIAPSPVQSQG